MEVRIKSKGKFYYFDSGCVKSTDKENECTVYDYLNEEDNAVIHYIITDQLRTGKPITLIPVMEAPTDKKIAKTKDAKLIAERLYNATSYMDADDYEEKCEENVEQMVKELNLLPENSVLISRLQLLINREDSTNRLDSKITTSSLLFSKKVINAIAEYEEKNKIHERVTCWFGDYAIWAYNAYNEYKIINRLKEMINSEFKGDDEIEKQIRFIDWLLGDEAQNINTVYAVASSLEFDELVWLTQEPEKYFEKRIKVQE